LETAGKSHQSLIVKEIDFVTWEFANLVRFKRRARVARVLMGTRSRAAALQKSAAFVVTTASGRTIKLQ
jgi:hypothetical protein